ncbi:MAG: hypothetical protein ACOWWO_16675 [Peptococcaceae bacterium]
MLIIIGCSNPLTLKNENENWKVQISGDIITIESKKSINKNKTIYFEVMPKNHEDEKVSAKYDLKKDKITTSFKVFDHFPEDENIMILIQWDNHEEILELKRK